MEDSLYYLIVGLRWEEVAALSQIVVKAIFLVSKLDLPDAHSEAISHWLIDGDGVDFPGLNYFLTYGEKVLSSNPCPSILDLFQPPVDRRV